MDGWLAGWLAWEAGLRGFESGPGPRPKWPIRRGLGGFGAKCGPSEANLGRWLAVAGWLKLAGRLAMAGCLAGRPGYSKSIVFLAYFEAF